MGISLKKLKTFNLLKCNLKTKYNNIESVLTSPEGFLELNKISIDNNPEGYHMDRLSLVAAK